VCIGRKDTPIEVTDTIVSITTANQWWCIVMYPGHWETTSSKNYHLVCYFIICSVVLSLVTDRY